MSELPEPVTEKIRDLCAEGYCAYDNGNFKLALRQFYQAWLLLPKPQFRCEAAGWILAALGDTYFQLSRFPQAIEALNSARHCPGTQRHPFIHLRLGQSLLDSGQITRARQHLLTAFKLGGAAVFTRESTRYYTLIADLVPDIPGVGPGV